MTKIKLAVSNCVNGSCHGILESLFFNDSTVYFFSLQCQDVAAFLQYKVSLLPVEQYQKVSL